MSFAEPNASRAVLAAGLNAWVALHRYSDGRAWVYRRQESGNWVSVRSASEEDLATLATAGALDFPILLSAEERAEHPDWPQCVPFEVVGRHAEQCRINHGQSPMQIAELGGLAPGELFAVLNDLDGLNALKYCRDDAGAMAAIGRLVAESGA